MSAGPQWTATPGPPATPEARVGAVCGEEQSQTQAQVHKGKLSHPLCVFGSVCLCADCQDAGVCEFVCVYTVCFPQSRGLVALVSKSFSCVLCRRCKPLSAENSPSHFHVCMVCLCMCVWSVSMCVECMCIWSVFVCLWSVAVCVYVCVVHVYSVCVSVWMCV